MVGLLLIVALFSKETGGHDAGILNHLSGMSVLLTARKDEVKCLLMSTLVRKGTSCVQESEIHFPCFLKKSLQFFYFLSRLFYLLFFKLCDDSGPLYYQLYRKNDFHPSQIVLIYYRILPYDVRPLSLRSNFSSL